MKMPEGFKTLDYLADNSRSVISYNGHTLNQEFLQATRDRMRSMAKAIQKFVDEYDYGDSAASHLALKKALLDFKDWSK